MPQLLTVLLLSLSFWSLAGCGRCHCLRPDQKRFLRLPSAEQERMLGEYPLDRQVELYLLAAGCLRPDGHGLVTVVAKNGSSAVPVLSSRLEAERDDFVKDHLLYVFLWIQEGCYYGVGGDEKLMTFLREQVSSMKTEGAKAWGRGYLEGILEAKHWRCPPPAGDAVWLRHGPR